jgi:hypothetical protein
VTDADHYALADDVTEHVVASAKTNDRGPTQRLDEWTHHQPLPPSFQPTECSTDTARLDRTGLRQDQGVVVVHGTRRFRDRVPGLAAAHGGVSTTAWGAGPVALASSSSAAGQRGNIAAAADAARARPFDHLDAVDRPSTGPEL